MPHSTVPPLSIPLYVNDGLLGPDRVGYLRESFPYEPLEELRRRLQQEGYLFLKGLLPRDDVLKARKDYFTYLAPSGVLAPGTLPVDGIFDENNDRLDYPGIGAGSTDANGRPRGGLFVDLALKAHAEPWYKDEFCKHPALHSFIAKITGWGDENTLGLTRSLLRNNTPHNKAIGVHYDQIFLRHGEDTSMTAWVPMGDVALDGGGLIYLENGHTLGQEIEKDFYEKAKQTGLTEEEAKNAFNKNMMGGGLIADGAKSFADAHARRWLVTDYQAVSNARDAFFFFFFLFFLCISHQSNTFSIRLVEKFLLRYYPRNTKGDVVLHTPYMIHASTINKDPKNVIRLGTDLRFVDSSKSYDKRWTNVYAFGDGV